MIDFASLDRYWRAANYLTVGQIYLLENPLLRERLRAEHIKPRLLGHWGTSPGLSLIYVHLESADLFGCQLGRGRGGHVRIAVRSRRWPESPVEQGGGAPRY